MHRFASLNILTAGAVRFSLFQILIFTAVTGTASAWGELGHDSIAALAQGKLNPATAKQVNTLLGNVPMSTVASWADWIRLGETQKLAGGEAEKADVEKALPGSDDWHFVDLPLGVQVYTPTAPSAGPNDVVSGINRCIQILEGPDSKTAGGRDMHNIALKMLIHLVGDIHQPFHVACRYYRLGPVGPNTVVTDPAIVASENLPDDRGANNLTYGGSGELHAVWDDNIVLDIDAAHPIKPPSKPTPESLAAEVVQVSSFLQPNLTSSYRVGDGEYHEWAARWAADAVPIAQKAYDGIVISGTLVQNPKPGHSGEIAPTPMVGFDLDTYISANRVLAQNQILKASGRLSDLLNSISWHD